jgi:hypothetical protein
LAGEGDIGLVKGVYGGVDEGFNVIGRGVSGHNGFPEGIDGGLDDYVG